MKQLSGLLTLITFSSIFNLMEKVTITIIGAGVIGLAIAAEVSKKRKDIILLEKNEKFGQETSSRNSEVIHAGIYYPENSLKAKFCVEGKMLLYDFLEKYSLPYKRCGKFIVAVEKNEIEKLYLIKEQASKNGVDDLKFIEKNELKKFILNIRGKSALFSPSTGIFDTYKFMQTLETIAKNNKVLISYNSEVIGIEKVNGNYKIIVKEQDNTTFEFLSEIVVNCAGLYSEKIAQIVGINTKSAGYKIYYGKGEYFSLPGKYKNLFNSLIYPVIPLNSKSLGIHTVLDLQGMIRLGPNIFYVKEIDYSVDESHREEFYNAVKRYFPFIEEDELSPDMAGIRPKLQGPGDDFKDFVINEETDKGLPGFINLIGIDSPGLTSSLKIAKYVSNKI